MEINLASLTALSGVLRSMKNWIARKKRRGEETPSADEIWNRIRKEYSYLSAEEREIIFQECEDYKI